MESCGVSTDYFEIEWHVENFHFCWHKTGERLESPLFNINIPCKTSWKLWLYPRGEDDGEYISCYLFRAEGGPEYVDVDFDLHLFIRDTLLKYTISLSKIYSFKRYQREGLGCFVSRWKLFAPIASQKDNCTLIVCCRMFNPSIEGCKKFIFTRIEIERVYGTDIFDYDTDVDPLINKAIGIKPIMEDEPLININLSYVQESLVMKICPVNCKGIKYATIKISVIENRVNKSRIQHVRSWIGEIKTDTCRYKVPRPDEELAKPDIEANIHKTFLLHFDFTFSTGVAVEKCRYREYDSDIRFSQTSMRQCLNSIIKKVESARNAVESLVDVFRSTSYSDVKIATGERRFPAHKAIACSRSSITIFPAELNLLTFRIYTNIEDFFKFLYSDAVEFTSWRMALQLYIFAAVLNVQLLKSKCRNFLMDKLDYQNACVALHLFSCHKDFPMKAFVENYILTYYDLILFSNNWETLAVSYPNLPKDIMLLKYKKYKCNNSKCV